ncbi:MAG: phenylacetate-CoA oxygenase subunit PaaJ [Saprospiraceae bacterium]|nr:phenylacetate-CoA oxygenase subunit PaaJ [Saprospiraceae bacterium]
MKDTKEIWQLLETVSDPEIPVLSVVDLGIIREIKTGENQETEIVITPTYSGCPAMNMIEVNIRAAMQDAGFDPIKVTTVLSPAWTTSWMSEAGKQKLKAYGIAPPVEDNMDKNQLFPSPKKVPCPHCGSEHTELVSQFGSTACKSLYKCLDCFEPFDYFKCH